jgi:hypothetical protein
MAKRIEYSVEISGCILKHNDITVDLSSIKPGEVGLGGNESIGHNNIYVGSQNLYIKRDVSPEVALKGQRILVDLVAKCNP